MFTRLAEVQKLERKKFMEQYANDLSNESDKRVREQKYNEMQLKEYELAQALNKKREADFLNQQTMATKKSMQTVLAQDYENAMRLKKLQAEDERRQNLMAGQATNSKAQMELNYLRKAEEDKKKMIREILTSDKTVHDDKKRMHDATQNMSAAEAKKLMEENEQRERFKEYQNSQKYNNFNQFQNQINQSYRDQVARPELEKMQKMNQILRKQEEEVKRKQEMDQIQRDNAQKNWRLNNRAAIEMQIRDKQSGRKVGETEFEVDYNNRLKHERDVNDVEYFEKFKKKQQQNEYKEMLDTQLRVSKQRRLYGNMTGVEKRINKDDLLAWKNYDHNTYALIPGLNSSKKPIPDKIFTHKQEHKKDRSFDQELHRMNQFGFTRDVTLARNPAYSAQIAGTTRKLPDTHSLDSRREAQISRGKHQASSSNIGYPGGSPQYKSGGEGHHKVSTSEVPNRNLLKSGHAKYPNHHLYSNYNPISGAFGQGEGAGHKTVFRNAGSNIFY